MHSATLQSMAEGRKEEPNSIHRTLTQSRVQWEGLENREAQSGGTEWELGQRIFFNFMREEYLLHVKVKICLNLASFKQKHS